MQAISTLALRESWRQIAEAAEARLAISGYAALKGVTCNFCEGVLTLRGRVPSYYLKQLASAHTLGTPGVELVVNNLEVRPWDE